MQGVSQEAILNGQTSLTLLKTMHACCAHRNFISRVFVYLGSTLLGLARLVNCRYYMIVSYLLWVSSHEINFNFHKVNSHQIYFPQGQLNVTYRLIKMHTLTNIPEYRFQYFASIFLGEYIVLTSN